MWRFFGCGWPCLGTLSCPINCPVFVSIITSKHISSPISHYRCFLLFSPVCCILFGAAYSSVVDNHSLYPFSFASVPATLDVCIAALRGLFCFCLLGVLLFLCLCPFVSAIFHLRPFSVVAIFPRFADKQHRVGVYVQVTETCYGGDLHQWVDRRLRRRQRHARRRTVSFCSMDDSNTAQLQQQEQQEQQQQAIDPGLAQPSSAPTAATATAATTPNSMAGDSSRPLSPVASVGSGRAGSSMRISCPVAAGAAAAAATAAAAASGLAASSSPLSSSPTAAGAAGAAGAAAGGRPLVSEEMASQIAGQMLCALRYLHSREIAHCDIKLENILLAAELDDSEATGDGASSEEEEAALMQQQELELQQQQLLQQEQERNTCANSRARPSLRRQTGHNSSSSINSSSSLNALSVVPMVLRKRRGLGGGDGERSEPIDRDKETDKTRERDRGKAIDRSSRNLSLPVARDSPSDSTHSLVGKFRRKNITVKLADFGLAKKIVRGRPRQKVRLVICAGLSVSPHLSSLAILFFPLTLSTSGSMPPSVAILCFCLSFVVFVSFAAAGGWWWCFFSAVFVSFSSFFL